MFAGGCQRFLRTFSGGGKTAKILCAGFFGSTYIVQTASGKNSDRCISSIYHCSYNNPDEAALDLQSTGEGSLTIGSVCRQII